MAAGDLFVELIIGNLLAMLSWTFLTAPIATRTRLNLYWQLRKITGPYLLIIYNVVNALMMRLLDFVALYGLILMPMGTVSFADFWLFPNLGLKQNYAEWKDILFSWPAAIAWGVDTGSLLVDQFPVGPGNVLPRPAGMVHRDGGLSLGYAQQRTESTRPVRETALKPF